MDPCTAAFKIGEFIPLLSHIEQNIDSRMHFPLTQETEEKLEEIFEFLVENDEIIDLLKDHPDVKQVWQEAMRVFSRAQNCLGRAQEDRVYY